MYGSEYADNFPKMLTFCRIIGSIVGFSGCRPHIIVFFIEALDRRFIIFGHSYDDFSVIGRVLLFDNDVIFVKMPASIILSPMISNIKTCSPGGTIRSGSGKYSSIFSTAVIGIPAVTFPMTGTFTTWLFGIWTSSSSNTSIALGLVGSRLIRPFVSSRAKWPCTVELEASPTASPISLTEGGYPFVFTSSLIKRRISSRLLIASSYFAPQNVDFK